MNMKDLFLKVSLCKIIETIKKVSVVDSTVLVLGETGVGKSRLVRHLHEMSNRKNESFYEINCAALPNLSESELLDIQVDPLQVRIVKGKGIIRISA